ncbi:MAG TPA: hypothetical protein VEO53_02270, partial [Candidatus Binatia bacterium]|nr:hypothetical protein [Candidatus Binatia bacterium]
YFSISPQVEKLPQPSNRQASNQKAKTRRVAMSTRELPVAPSGRSAKKAFTVAQAGSIEPGFAIDYNLVSSTANQTFQSDTTYYVSGTCTLSGVTTLEGGACIKYTNNAELRISGVLNCQTAPYRLAILTSKDDDAVGETITGSTGNPSTNYAAGIALHFYVGYNFYSDLRHVRIAHAQTAIQYDAPTYDAGSPNRLAHAQLVHCQRGIVPNNMGFLLRNVLMNNVLTNFYNTGNSTTGRVEHLTIDQANLVQGNTNITLYLTNSLLVGVSAYGTYSGAYNATGVVSDFVAVGGGAHYLAANTWRNAGTTNIHPELLADLKKKTTYPPLLYSNAVISVDTVLAPQAGRDTDTPDLGYHYPPLDYLFGGVTNNANLTFSAGTAVGWFRTTQGWQHAGHGIHIADRKTVTFDGHEDAPNYFVRLNGVQESPGAPLYGPGGITGWATYLTDAPTLQARFTSFAIPANEFGANHFRDDWGYLIAGLTDCQFFGGGQGSYVSTYAFTNCLFDRENLWLQTGAADDSWTLRNCLVRGGSLSLARTTAMPVSIRDCAFDGTTISTG